MTTIPKTQKKLREAQFFLSKVIQEEGTVNLDKEYFDFYFSAFLTAARSVRDVLENEHPSYIAWYNIWKTKLPSDKLGLINFTNSQRNIEVHEQGAHTTEDIVMVPAAHAQSNSPMHAAYFDPEATLGQKNHLIKIKGKEENAVEVGRLYLDLLVRLVKEFEKTLPT